VSPYEHRKITISFYEKVKSTLTWHTITKAKSTHFAPGLAVRINLEQRDDPLAKKLRGEERSDETIPVHHYLDPEKRGPEEERRRSGELERSLGFLQGRGSRTLAGMLFILYVTGGAAICTFNLASRLISCFPSRWSTATPWSGRGYTMGLPSNLLATEQAH
jgi:hypothetical protein